MFRFAALLALCAAVLRAEPAAAPAPLEAEVSALIAGPQVTIVHFWAPWCPNCKAEMGPDGWAKFIADNPDVKFVFLNIWHKGQDPLPKLAAAGLGAQPNLTLLTHPNPSRLQAERVNSFLGLPITWLPTTWVFRDGKLRFALNYGEVRFGLLQQFVNDSREKWDR
ncbi:MAG: thioredoxin family protein [Opitutae bacterium]|nr:thioredoxin family protein [Opitutae bacterium]